MDNDGENEVDLSFLEGLDTANLDFEDLRTLVISAGLAESLSGAEIFGTYCPSSYKLSQI